METLIILLITALAVAVVVAYLAGVRRGRAAERVVFNRFIHDTVLQALEAMALRRSSDSHEVTEFRDIARAQAAVLRRGLSEPAGGRLIADLSELATDMSREGLRAQLVSADIDDTLPDARRKAVRDATREALRNALKHGGTKQIGRASCRERV